MARIRKRKLVWLFGLALVISLVGLTSWLTLRREPTLIELAEPILAIDTSSPEYKESRESAEWLSDDQLLIVSTDHYPNVMDEVGNDWRGHLDCFSIKSHTRNRLVGLSELVSKRGMNIWGAPCEFELNPSGTRLHWQNYRHGGRLRYDGATAKMDGSQYREWGWEYSDNFWMDDIHYVEGSEGSGHKISVLNVHDVTNFKNDSHYAPSSIQASNLLRQYHQTHPSRVSCAADDRKSEYQIFSPTSEDTDQPDYTVKFPVDSKPMYESVAPGDRLIVYHLRTEKIPPILVWLHRVNAAIPARPELTEGLWISRADGTGMHELGHVPAESELCLKDLNWAPDGKRLSFVYHGMLNVVAASAVKH